MIHISKYNHNSLMELTEKVAILLLVTLSVFDQLRESLPITGFISTFYALLRDLLIIFLTIYYSNSFRKRSIFLYFVIVFLGFSILLSILNGLPVITAIKSFWLYFKFFLIYHIFYCYFSRNSMINVLKILIILGILLIFLNFIIVLFFSSILTLLFSNGLRLTIGNSSIISFFYLSIYILLDNNQIFKKKHYCSILKIIFIVAIFSTVTTTAFIALLFYHILKFFLSNLKDKIMIFVFFCSMFIIFLFLSKHIFTTNEIFEYINDKISQIIEILSGKSLKNIGTLSTRAYQKQILCSKMNSYDYILGLGIQGYSIYIPRLENFYNVMLFNHGFIFFTLFIMFFLINIILALINKRNFYIYIISIFFCYCYTLDFFLPYMTNFFFAFILAIEKTLYKEKCIP